jgi:hypothetical protein
VSLSTAAATAGDAVGLLTADDTGTVHGTVQAPAAPGPASISVTGYGPTGDQVEDSATFTVAAPGTTCAS